MNKYKEIKNKIDNYITLKKFFMYSMFLSILFLLLGQIILSGVIMSLCLIGLYAFEKEKERLGL